MHFQTSSLQPPDAPLSRPCFLLRAGFASDSLWLLSAVRRTSLIARSLVSRIWPYRVCFAGSSKTHLFYRLSVHFQLLSTSPRGDAVTFGSWREAPPQRDFHPPVHALSQAHERGSVSRSMSALPTGCGSQSRAPTSIPLQVHGPNACEERKEALPMNQDCRKCFKFRQGFRPRWNRRQKVPL